MANLHKSIFSCWLSPWCPFVLPSLSLSRSSSPFLLHSIFSIHSCVFFFCRVFNHIFHKKWFVFLWEEGDGSEWRSTPCHSQRPSILSPIFNSHYHFHQKWTHSSHHKMLYGPKAPLVAWKCIKHYSPFYNSPCFGCPPPCPVDRHRYVKKTLPARTAITYSFYLPGIERPYATYR